MECVLCMKKRKLNCDMYSAFSRSLERCELPSLRAEIGGFPFLCVAVVGDFHTHNQCQSQGQVAATGGDDNMVNIWRIQQNETKKIMVGLSLRPRLVSSQVVIFFCSVAEFVRAPERRRKHRF